MSKHELLIKRAYEAPAPHDGWRVLVDRVWPRGVGKDALKADLWLKDAAPSAELRKWFGHDPARWDEFRMRYFAELRRHPETLGEITAHLERGTVTLVYGAKDEQHNQAVALREFIERGAQ